MMIPLWITKKIYKKWNALLAYVKMNMIISNGDGVVFSQPFIIPFVPFLTEAFASLYIFKQNVINTGISCSMPWIFHNMQYVSHEMNVTYPCCISKFDVSAMESERHICIKMSSYQYRNFHDHFILQWVSIYLERLSLNWVGAYISRDPSIPSYCSNPMNYLRHIDQHHSHTANHNE